MSNSNTNLSFFNTVKFILIVIAIMTIIKKLPTPYLISLIALTYILDSIESYKQRGKLSVFKTIIAIACIILAIVMIFVH
ncbi:hypothetical protein [Wukongibacter sp. M2B1]|uniref:hypothetical protein n=1 Tax=Wukongibacter sp. M2B1 TaxID=3088895 RepID=UPI003D7B5142